MDIGLNKYYHSSVLAAEVAVYNMKCTSAVLDMQKYENTATMSGADRMQRERAAQEKILGYVNGLIGKAALISTADIAAVLEISEDFVIQTLTGYGMDLEDEE